MYRIGVDLVEIARLERSLRRSAHFLQLCFSDAEVKEANQYRNERRSEYLAGRLASKEAVLKALHMRIEDTTTLKEIEVLGEMDGSPRLRLLGCIAQFAANCSLSEWQVSISHDAGIAIAFVLFN
jgi:holo-[acyl-carrier protein] synthase